MKFKSQQVATGAFLVDSHYMDPKEHFGHSYFFRSTSGFPTGSRCQVPGQGKFDFKTRLNEWVRWKEHKNGVFAR